MTHQEFMDKIWTQKASAHKLLSDHGEYNILLGMGHSISGFSEDLFSVYVATKFNKPELLYYVDKVISIQLPYKRKAKSFKPDLMVIGEGNVVTHYFDVKTDLGWNRNAEEYLKTKNDFINSIRGRAAWITKPDSSRMDVKVSSDLVYQMVVISGWNINQDLLKLNAQIADSMQFVKMYVLWTKKDETETFSLDEAQFSQLDKDAIEILNNALSKSV